MPTAQEILDSFLGINDYTINTKETEFNHDNMTVIIQIYTMENTGAVCDGCGMKVNIIKDRSCRLYRDKPVFDWTVYLRIVEAFYRIRGYISTIRKYGVDTLHYLQKVFQTNGNDVLLPKTT